MSLKLKCVQIDVHGDDGKTIHLDSKESAAALSFFTADAEVSDKFEEGKFYNVSLESAPEEIIEAPVAPVENPEAPIHD